MPRTDPWNCEHGELQDYLADRPESRAWDVQVLCPACGLQMQRRITETEVHGLSPGRDFDMALKARVGLLKSHLIRCFQLPPQVAAIDEERKQTRKWEREAFWRSVLLECVRKGSERVIEDADAALKAFDERFVHE